jgi:IS30 family transposase
MKRHPEILKKNIAYSIAQGYTQREIAIALKVNQSTISRHARRPDVMEMIRAEEAVIVREYEERLHRAAQDPEVKAEADRVCKKALMQRLKRVVR